MKIILVVFIALFSCANCFIEEENDDKNGLLYAGDMMLTPLQRIIVETGGDLSNPDGIKTRSAMKDANVLWLPNDKTVPYIVDYEIESQAEATLGLTKALREWEERSCLKFKRRSNETDYINFFKESGCWSYVGRQGGKQNISLGEGCWGVGTVVHEIGHAMGFGHEQNRPDRDQYIKIRWENIPERKKHNFQKYSDAKVDSLNSSYDYKSFMQYSKKSFGVNDSVTLDPIKPDIFQLGQRVGFTDSDQFQAMKLYRCNGKTTRTHQIYERYAVQGDEKCDFESGMCNYTQDGTDNFDWSRRYGGTPSGNTGPDVDHTTSRLGTFVYIEASYPRIKGDKARLMTRYFAATQESQCLSFFLHMYSTNKTMMGQFNVYLNDADNNNQLLLQKTGSQAVNDWTNVQMKFKPSGKYQIVFEGIRGNSYQGDIALDDISFTSKDCVTQIIKKVPAGPGTKEGGKCEDTKDREARYCKQWKIAGYCSSQEKHMSRFCKKTCSLCQ